MIPSNFGYIVGHRTTQEGKEILDHIRELTKKLSYAPIQQPNIPLVVSRPIKQEKSVDSTVGLRNYFSKILLPEIRETAKKKKKDGNGDGDGDGTPVSPVQPKKLFPTPTPPKGKRTPLSIGELNKIRVEGMKQANERVRMNKHDIDSPSPAVGEGKTCADDADDEGLYDDQIEKILESKTHRFVPVIMCDEIPSLLPLINKRTRQFAFVINNEPSTKKGQHWRAVFIDFEKYEIDYYDSLVSQPSKRFLQDIKLLVDKVDPPVYMKLKVNMIKQQSDDSSDCGYFCIKFITDMFKGRKFTFASGFDNSKAGQYEIDKFKNYI
jgi:hypothetical protein